MVKELMEKGHEQSCVIFCDLCTALCRFVFALILSLGCLGCFVQGESPMLTKFLNGSKAGLGRPGILGANFRATKAQMSDGTYVESQINFHLRTAFASAKCSEGPKHCEQDETEHESLRFAC